MTNPDLPNRITADWLKEHGVSRRDIQFFNYFWPEGAGLTPEFVLKAIDMGLDMSWLWDFIPNSLRAKFDQQVASLLIAALWPLAE